jgi:hypothetical protein
MFLHIARKRCNGGEDYKKSEGDVGSAQRLKPSKNKNNNQRIKAGGSVHRVEYGDS